ncbi:MAG: uroporphyrinogen decarboxylase family protein [Planctomycetota bacterium]|jgi:uroporphyrinogen decarboxylase
MNAIERFRATHDFKPVDHLYRKEFYIWDEARERWRGEGMPEGVSEEDLFGFDERANIQSSLLGWCEPAFVPAIEERILEAGNDYEIVIDNAGRTVKFFKGRRHGFMPTYLKHAVASDKDWYETIAPLFSPDTPSRWDGFDETIAAHRAAEAEGRFIQFDLIGGYMYLRALVGPVDVCYMFVDNPKLIHAMMQSWLDLADAVSARIQEHVEFDEVFIAEDICYNHGLLISPSMVREFIFPYYSRLLENVRSRQKRRPHFHVDTDGNVDEAIDLYLEVGMDKMSPFEVAANNDVIEVAEKYPDLIIEGGIDKRLIAAGPPAIDEHLERIIPFMVKRGGYTPTCDHGVPDNVSYADYMHYRRKMMELDGG